MTGLVDGARFEKVLNFAEETYSKYVDALVFLDGIRKKVSTNKATRLEIKRFLCDHNYDTGQPEP